MRPILTAIICLATAAVTQAADVTWDGSESSDWDQGLNWDNDVGPVTAGDNAIMHSGTVLYTAASSANLNGLLLYGGTMTVSEGLFRATNHAPSRSVINDTLYHTGGTAELNKLEVGGTATANGICYVQGGDLIVSRDTGGISLYLGGNFGSDMAGTGTLEIIHGSLRTRAGIHLGDPSQAGIGTFAVLGSSAREIGIGSHSSLDGRWVQKPGSILKVGIDYAGVTKIFIDDVQGTGSTYATFENGALLDIDYYTNGHGGGTWIVMEVENGNITDNGLALAPGVDTNIWSFGIDNSGPNGILYVSATGAFAGHALTVGNTLQQKMRYGMDYERLWYWTSSLNAAERDDIARWSAVDTDIDYIRVAMNSGYELTEGTYDLSAYTSRIIPVMQEMKQANPKLQFFASPRPLNEAVSGATWQPYPLWVTGAPDYSSSLFDFDATKCAEYIVRYLILMKSYGFKISFLDVTNEWQDNYFGRKLTQPDLREIHKYLNVTYLEAPWEHPSYSGITLTADDMPQLVAASAHAYNDATTWINGLTSGLDPQAKIDAVEIASAHNTDRGGDAQTFVDKVKEVCNPGTEIWNTEAHGWKSTSGENETTSFYYYLEAIRAGIGGINGWLAIGTTGQGHAYILNPSGTPTRNVKYHIFRKLSATSNYGHALDILEEPGLNVLNAPLDSDDDAVPRNVAAFIKGRLMTVWVINENRDPVPLEIAPSGHTIATKTVRQTRWTDPGDVEGFETLIPVVSDTAFQTVIPGSSVCCFELVLDTEDFARERLEAEAYTHHWGTSFEDHTTYQNLGYINAGDWIRFGSVALSEDAILAFRVARPSGRPDGLIRVREGHSEGRILGEVSIPITGHWQVYETVFTQLDVEAGIYNLYLEFVEDGTTTGNALTNIDWFEVQADEAPDHVAETPVSGTSIRLSWDAVPDAIGYTVKRSTVQGGPYTVIDDTVTGTNYTDTGLQAGTVYYYVIVTRYPAVESGESDEIAAVPSNPISPESIIFGQLAIRCDGGSGDVFCFSIMNSELGHLYQAQNSSSLMPDDWTDAGALNPGNGGVLDFTIPKLETDTQYFYRVRITRQ